MSVDRLKDLHDEKDITIVTNKYIDPDTKIEEFKLLKKEIQLVKESIDKIISCLILIIKQ